MHSKTPRFPTTNQYRSAPWTNPSTPRTNLRTAPYATGSYSSSDGKRMHSQITQLRVGMDNGALFSLGKPLKVVESDGETLVITVQKVEP